MALQTLTHKRPSPPVEVVYERGRKNVVVLHYSKVAALEDGGSYLVGEGEECGEVGWRRSKN